MLRIEHLTKKYGDKKAVDDLSLHIQKGEIYGFIGHNGAGKTTTIKSCCGILNFDEGEIYVDGVSVKEKPLECKRKIAYIPDNPDLIPFGYCMKNGVITTDPKEVCAVATIFSEYLSGKSLLQIAKLMESEKIRYNTDSQPGMKQQTFVAGFSAGAGASAGGIGYNESVAPTLKGSPGGNCMPSVLCLNDQGGSVMNCSENISGTLRAQEHGHQPLVYENHGIDSRYTGPHKVAPTMSARYGTGFSEPRAHDTDSHD